VSCAASFDLLFDLGPGRRGVPCLAESFSAESKIHSLLWQIPVRSVLCLVFHCFPLEVFRSTWPHAQAVARALRFFLSPLSLSVLISEQQSAPKVCFSLLFPAPEFWSPSVLVHTTTDAQLSPCKDRECARGLFWPGSVFVLSVCGHQA
jgi:hypothetical protein